MQPGRRVDNVADSGEVVDGAFSDVADERFTDVKADPYLGKGPVIAAIADGAQKLERMLHHELRHLFPRDATLHIWQVQRHHLVAHDLVDDRLGKQDPLSAPVEPSQEIGDRRRIGGLCSRGEAAEIREQHTGVERHTARR